MIQIQLAMGRKEVGVIVERARICSTASLFLCEERQLVATNECGKVQMCTVIYGPQISWASLLERRPRPRGARQR